MAARKKRKIRKSTYSRRKRSSRRKNSSSRIWWYRVGLVMVLVLVTYVVYLDFTVRKQMEGTRWSLPASIYTQPMELYAGKALTVKRLQQELQALGYRNDESLAQPGSYYPSSRQVDVYTRGFQFWDSSVPSKKLRVSFSKDRIKSVSTFDDQQIAITRLEPLQIGNVSPVHHEDRQLISLDEVPHHLVGALLAIEDKNYAQHLGIDIRGLARAMWANIRAGSLVQGGSTITQQLVKNFYLTSERTVTRKLKEMAMALLLELHYDKREILETYLNEVYLGQSGNRAIHGFGLASLFYFGRPVTELDISEAALLVGMVRGASYYNPRKHPQRAKARRDLVIAQMEKLDYLTPEEARAAQNKPLNVTESHATSATVYPAFFDLMRRQLRKDYVEEDLNTAGLRLFTTLDPEIQSIVETAVANRIKEIEGRFNKGKGWLNAAVVVARVESGEVVAIAGDRRPRFLGFNRALDAQRPVGSVMKPVVYLTALEASADFNLATLIKDEPITITQKGAPDWTPENHTKKYYGDTLLIDALAKSMNVSTTKIGMDVGIDKVVDMAHRLGITREIQPYPSVVLGAAELTPLEVTQLYLTIANNGFRTALRSTRSILSSRGRPLARYPIEVKQVVEPDVVALLHYAMQEVVRTGTARALNRQFRSDLGLAGKTGTTDGLRDSWFAGYSGNYVTVVWMGRDDNQPSGLNGSSGAMLLWADIMSQLDLTPTYPVKRARIRFTDVDAKGRQARGCVSNRNLPFIKGSEPNEKAPCAKLER